MSYPKVSLLWINYNSSDFKDVVKKSISSIQNLKYSDVELIVVDGGSTDESPDYVEKLLKKSSIDYKFVKQKENLGLHSSWNLAYSRMDKKSKYFMLLNNDAVIYPNTINKFVNRMENDDKLGALNGIELRWGTKLIDHAGMIFDEMFITNPLSRGLNVSYHEKEEHVISLASAVLGIFRKKATENIGKKLLEENMFRHFNETVLGARLWTSGYKIIYMPFVTGEHHTKLVEESRSFVRLYYALRGWLTLLFISNSPYKDSMTKDSFMVKQMMNRLLKKFELRNYIEALKYYRKVTKDAKEKAEDLAKRKISVDLYKIPHIKGFRYYWMFPRILTSRVQQTKTFSDLLKEDAVYIPDM